MTPEEFAASIKSKYPAYKDVPDDQLVEAMLTKYPVYKDQVEMGPSQHEIETHGDIINPQQNLTGAEEPTTFMGQLGKKLSANPLIQGAAHPQTAGDVLTLAIPSELGMGRGGMDILKDFTSRSVGAVKRAAAPVKTASTLSGQAGNVAAVPFRAVREFSDALPSANEAAISKFRGGAAPAAPSSGVTVLPNTPDLVDKYRVRAKAPAGTPTVVEAPTIAPDATVTPTRFSELQRKLGGRGQEGVTGSDVTLASEAPRTATTTEKPKLSATEVAEGLRRQYGSRDAGKMLYGDAIPAAERAESIKRLAPGPSRIPLAAEERIRKFEQKSRMSDDEILSMLIAGLGGGELAGSVIDKQ